MAHHDRQSPRDQGGRGEGRRFDEEGWYQGRDESQDQNAQWGRHQPRQGGDFEDRYSGRGGNEARGNEGSQRGQWREQSYGRGRYEDEDHLRAGGSYGGNYESQGEGRDYFSNEGERGRSYGQSGSQYGEGRRGYGYEQGRDRDAGRQSGQSSQQGRYGQGQRRQAEYGRPQDWSSERYGSDYSMAGAGLQGQWERGYGEMSRGTSGGYGGGPSGQQDWSGASRGSQSGGYSGSSSLGGATQQGQRQSFRGKGPKGYQRSDERLKEIICERLMEDPNIDASEISVEVRSLEVTLEGTVDDRRTKYEIEEMIEHFGGVKEVKNQLRVRARGSESGADRNVAAQLSTSESNYGTSGRSGASTGSSSSASPSSGSGTQTRNS
jgi:osmotically-inducible protein OsmY